MTPPAAARVLLVQWFANGDCLLATPVARQIKADFPGCHLTWAVATRCRQTLLGNPDVDARWEVDPPPTDGRPETQAAFDAYWKNFRREVRARQASGEFTHVFLTQSGGRRNLHHYDGTVRGLIYGAYDRPITVSNAPEMVLDEAEVDNVRRFVDAHPVILRYDKVALFECAPQSGQSTMTPGFALALGRRLLAEFGDLCLVLSSNVAFPVDDPRLVDASTLSFRENAELTRYCTLLIGCSSGISWLSTSTWAKPLPTVQILRAEAPIPNSLAVDAERRGASTEGIIELVDPEAERAYQCLRAVWREGFAAARRRFHERISLDYSYVSNGSQILNEGQYLRIPGYWWRTLRREGWPPVLAWRAVWSMLIHAWHRPRTWWIFRPLRRWVLSRRAARAV